MRTLMIPVLLAVTAASVMPAQAINRYNTGNRTCSQVQNLVVRDGAAILRYKSARSGNTLYDRYVRNGSFCTSDTYAAWTSVPTADARRCPVLFCKPRSDDDDLLFWRRKR